MLGTKQRQLAVRLGTFATLALFCFLSALTAQKMSMHKNGGNLQMQTTIAEKGTQGTRKLVSKELSISQPKKAFVCITGQLGRLEMENKIRTLIAPLQENGYEVGVALVLARGQAHFTHGSKPEERYDSEQAVMALLEGLPAVRVLNGPNFLYKAKIHPKPPQIHVDKLLKNDSKHAFERVYERAQNHVRMFESYKRCWDIEREDAHLHRQEEYPPPQFDVYFRLREDIGFREPFNITLVNEFVEFSRSETKPRVMLVSDCRSWRGINDRMAMVSKYAAEDFFYSPYQLFLEPDKRFGEKGNQVDWSRTVGTEAILQRVYEANDIRIVKSKYIRGVDRIIMEQKGDEYVDRFHWADNKGFCPEPF